MIDIRIYWVEELVNSLWGDKIKQALSTSIKKWIFLIERTAKINTPVDTWLLRNSYETDISDISGTLRNYREYAPYVHDRNSWMDRTIEQEEWNVQDIFIKEIDTLLSLL